ncbi:replication initiation protein [Ruegeria sp.]|uniref:replication initiation protein n=1 Tax=Ruegeria sp. TaxID=1879320 RepID=UPI003B00241E
MKNLTVPSSAIALRSEQPLSPAMVAVVWEIAAKLDEDRVPAQVPNSVWVEIAAKRLRGPGGRTDNIWLRKCLERLTEVKISGEYKGNPWGAVILAEWEISEGGSLARLLISPSGVQTFRTPETFAKIETHAAHRLTGHGRRLYAILADKKRLGRPSWTFSLDEIKALMGVSSRPSYKRFNTFRQKVLKPAVSAINDFGTIEVKMTPQKLGRSVVAVRFDWQWKDPRDASETVAENERHSAARRKAQDATDAPPMIDDHEQSEPALTWWHGLTDAERDKWADHVGRTFDAGGQTYPRREADIARDAFARHKQEQTQNA